MNDRRYAALHWAIILVTPFVLLVLNQNLFINPLTNKWIDPWLYTGFFWSLPDFLERWGDTYYATRLSWLLPGFAVHRLFSPLVANYVLHIAFFYVLLFAVYFIVTSGINRTTAFVVTMLVAWQPELISAMSWDYVDGAVITYFVITLLCLERASSSTHTWPWALGSGAGLTCLASANLVATTLWPICGLFLLLRVGVARWRTILAVAGVAAIGAVAMFAALGFANQQLGGRFLFLRASVNYASTNLWLPSPWDVKDYRWLQDAPALILPSVAAIGAVLALAGRLKIVRSFSGAVQVCTLAAVVWFVIHSTLWTHSLHISYYSSYLIPLGLLAVAVHPDSPLSATATFDLPRAVVMELAILGLLILHMLVFRYGDVMWQGIASPDTGFSTPFGINTYVAFAIATFALASMRFVRTLWYRWPAFLLALLMVCSSVPTNWVMPNAARMRDDYALTVSVHDFILQHLDRNRPLRMWYTIVAGEPRPFRNISSSYLWGYVLFNEAMPALEPIQASIEPTAQLVLMAATQPEIDTARQALGKLGLTYSPRVQKEFGRRNATFQVIIGNLAYVTE